jgi:translation initiation factor 2 alpha subunit (eIF-2alpha)
MMSEHRKQIVAQLKEYAAKQVKADKHGPWTKLQGLSDEQIAVVSGQTAGIEGAKARASKYVRNNTEFVKKLPTDFKKLADPKYVADKEKTKAEKAKEAAKPAAKADPAKTTAKAAA